jgi:hypothetical protein
MLRSCRKQFFSKRPRLPLSNNLNLRILRLLPQNPLPLVFAAKPQNPPPLVFAAKPQKHIPVYQFKNNFPVSHSSSMAAPFR